MLLTVLASTTHSKGQNLVQNPGLEAFEGKYPAGWYMIAGTPDLGTRHFVNPHLVTNGFFNPFLSLPAATQVVKIIEFGNICLCQGMTDKWSEVSQVELLRPLKRNKRYQVSLYVIKASTNNPPLKEISVYLSRHPLQEAFNPKGYSLNYTLLTSQSSLGLSSREKWVKVKGVYTAGGGERYLSIGNFLGANMQELQQISALKGEHGGQYYCYDNVSVIPLEEAEEEEIAVPQLPIVVHDAFIPLDFLTLEDAYFAFGQYELLSSAYPALNKLAEYLKRQPLVKVNIIGHTDNIGKQEDNLALSENRAKAVMNYLLSQGIAQERMTHKGVGALEPKESNHREEGRTKNRRVEIKLLNQ
jgi:outer membrane protein OmpA-like peptidoglycan-associated protein